MFAGQQAGDIVFEHMNGIGNVTNLQADAHMSYDTLRWGIEAIQEGQKVRACSYLHVVHFNSFYQGEVHI